MNNDRAIALVDCNNFFASCERVVNPELQTRPVAVLSHNDGIIISCSDEVKQLGVPRTAPLFQYRALLEKHNTALISANHALYFDFSHRVLQVLTDDIGAQNFELYSIDEAFLDVGVPDKLTSMGRAIKDLVFEKTKIPVSVGIARTKTLAKLANRLAKRSAKARGVLDLYDSPYLDRALAQTPVGKIWGVGPRSALHLQELGIETALELKQAEAARIRDYLNVFGARTVRELNGIKCITMEVSHRHNQSIAHTRTFGKTISSLEEVTNAVLYFTTRALEKMRWNDLTTRVVKVFLRTDRFNPVPYYYDNSASYRSVYHSDVTSEIYAWVTSCIEAVYRSGLQYKKAGVELSELKTGEAIPLRLFEQRDFERRHKLNKVIDELNYRYGRDILRFAVLKASGDWQGRSQHRGNDSYHAVGRDSLGLGKVFSKSVRFH